MVENTKRSTPKNSRCLTLGGWSNTTLFEFLNQVLIYLNKNKNSISFSKVKNKETLLLPYQAKGKIKPKCNPWWRPKAETKRHRSIKAYRELGSVAHVYNLSYLGGRDGKITVRSKTLVRPSINKQVRHGGTCL
jgi:hypothetical protein